MQNFLSTPEAAEFLGVSAQRIRALITQGDIEAEKVGGRWFIRLDGLERWLSVGRGVSGRPLSTPNAWAAIYALSGVTPSWVTGFEKKRILRGLGEFRELLPAKLRRRAFRMDFRGPPRQLDQLANDERLILSGARAANLYGVDLQGGGTVDGYVVISDLRRLRSDHSLASESPSNVVLRVLYGFWPFAPDVQVAPRAAVALDLIESDDERERRGGEALLDRVFEVLID